MREVVRTELEFVAVGGELQFGNIHDTGIVYKQMDLRRLSENCVGGDAH